MIYVHNYFSQFRLKMDFYVKVNDLKNGLIMYCAEREDGYGDFASIVLKNGFFEFKFDTGSGTKSQWSTKSVTHI